MRSSAGTVLQAAPLALWSAICSSRVRWTMSFRSVPTLPIRCSTKSILTRVEKMCLDVQGQGMRQRRPLPISIASWKQDGKRMAFVGKPCDVAAFRAFLRLHPNLASKVSCTISFFCAGTSSLRATEDVITAMGADKARVVDFRYRGRGWPGRARAVMDDGICYETSYRDSWGKILGRQIQFRCKICADGIGELADIACGDAWYTKDGQPDFEERPGRSLILSRTCIGQHVVEAAAGAGYLATEAFRLQDLAVIQPYQAMRRRLIASRLLAMWIVGAPFPKYRGFNLIANARQAFLQRKLG